MAIFRAKNTLLREEHAGGGTFVPSVLDGLIDLERRGTFVPSVLDGLIDL